MAASELKSFTIRFRCPKCGEMINVEVSRDVLSKTLGGIATIPVMHGSPPHLLVLYVDENGMIRGYNVYEHLVRLFEITLKDLIKTVTPQKLATIIFWVFMRDKISLKGEEKLVESVRDFLNQIFEQEVVVPGGFEVDITNPPSSVISVKPIVNLLNRIMEIENQDLALSWLRGEIRRIKDIIKFLEELAKSEKGKVSPRRIMREFNISKDILLLAIEIVNGKGLPIKDRINLVELRIKDLLI